MLSVDDACITSVLFCMSKSDGARYDVRDVCTTLEVSDYSLTANRSQQSATAGAAFTAAAGRHVSQSDQPAASEPAAAPAATVEPAEELTPASAESAACPPLPWDAKPEPEVVPAGAPLPLPGHSHPPPQLPPAAETKLLAVAPGFPADEVLWALRCQASCRGHPHLLQLRVRKL
jgi:uncharacterized membrane protein